MMWKEYLKTLENDQVSPQLTYDSWHFTNNQEGADELAELVLLGIKRATASALPVYEYEHEPLPEVGDLSVITNWSGESRCIIRTTKITVVPFKQVTPEFAATEGEGDKSLEHWRRVHERYFTEELREIGLEFTESTTIVCEEFELAFPVKA